MKINLQSLLKSIIKIAAVALTAPATLAIAGNLYIHPLESFIVQIAALILVEGCLLLGWYGLDSDHKAEAAQRWLYATLTLIAYGVLWVIAIAHQEGVAGIAFRATLGVLIGYSIFESGILANVTIKRNADRDIARHPSVKRYRRKAEIRHARAVIDAHFQVAGVTLQHDTDQRLKGVKMGHASVTPPDHTKMPLFAQSYVGLDKKPVKSRYRSGTAPKQPVVHKVQSKSDTLAMLIETLQDNPDVTKAELSRTIGRSRNTVYRYLSHLEDEGIIVEADTRSGYTVLLHSNSQK